MLAEESLRQGNLAEALDHLQGQIRKDPSNAKLRIFLFQLLVVSGEWKRAMNQLKVVVELDPSTFPMVNTYKEVMQCEMFKDEVFAGKRSPLIFGDPENWVGMLLESLTLLCNGNFEESQIIRSKAFENAPASGGTLNGDSFEWIADADPRTGPTLEVIMKGNYYWVPFNRIKKITIEEPADLRDMAWLPANFTWENGGEAVGFIPSRYPGSEKSEDQLIRLSRKTEWEEKGHDLYIGLGQRVLTTDKGDYPLLDVREITLGSTINNKD